MLIFDARHAADEFTGLGRYTSALLDALLRHPHRPPHIEVLLDAGSERRDRPVSLRVAPLLRSGDRVTRLDAPPFSWRHHVNIGRHVNGRRDTLYFYPHFDVPLSLRLPIRFVIHDLLPLAVDDYVRRQRAVRRLGFRALLTASLLRGRADAVAVSTSTKDDIARFISPRLANKVRVVPGASFLDPSAAGSGMAAGPRLPDRFLLYVGDRRPNKNLKKMVDVFRLLKHRHLYPGHLLIVGKSRNTSFDLDRYIADDDFILTLEPVPDLALATLYRRTDALFFLSTYEGFGLPVIEAAGFNRKIITSSTSSLPEVAPPGALLLDPRAPAERIAPEIARYLAETAQVDYREHCRRFSWQRTAEDIFCLAPSQAALKRTAA